MTEKVLDASPPAVRVQGLTKLFGGRYALRGIDLSVNRGECLVVFGPNGAGKTTLVKTLSTLVRPSSGNVWLDGVNIRSKPSQIRRKISLVSHQTFLYHDLSIYENLKFYGKMYGVADPEQRSREVIAQVQLESRMHDRVGALSRGLQQRASIARSVLHNPSILLLDEPEVGLDPQAVTAIRDILEKIKALGGTAVMTTHNLEQGLELADSVVILNRGQIVYQASKREVNIGSFPQNYARFTEAG